MRYAYSALYVALILAVNMAFAWRPDLNWLWAVGVGGIFLVRDMAQRQIGHRVLVPMLIGLALSYWLADPFVAFASAAAFAVSELTDWAVFTVTGWPLRDRLLWSCIPSACLDSAIFLGIIGFLTPWAFAAQVTSKVAAALLVWSGIFVRDARCGQPIR
jgi:hypothetical protein